MTAQTTTAATQSACTEFITPADFSTNVNDVNRDTWTVGTLYHVIKALAGRRVILVADKGTGHTLFNVTLNAAFRGGTGYRLRVTYVYDAAAERGQEVTDHHMHTCGAITVMPDPERTERVKYAAIESHRQHQSAAIALAKEQAAGTGREWGTWTATVISGSEVDVTYTPSTGNPAFADKWGERGHWRINVQG